MRGRIEAPNLFVVDAFTSRLFAGNPAAVMPMEEFPDDRVLRALAAENNLSETAFLVPRGEDYRIRWFTPTTEVPLCGHATLASGAIVLDRLKPGRPSVVFHSASGALTVRRSGAAYALELPALPARPALPDRSVGEALGRAPRELLETDSVYLAVYDDEREVRALAPNREQVAGLRRTGLIATAPGGAPYDFVSRFFAPALGVPEDPVTGMAHATLVPYWAGRLGRRHLRAYQASARGGELEGLVEDDHVVLTGACAVYAEGRATIPRHLPE